MDHIPFDAYDFFGYLASGLVVIVGMDLVLGFPHVLGRDLKVVDSVLLLLGMYVAGQVIATPAKALLEDGLVGKILYRPSVNLFREKKPLVRGLLFPGFYEPLPRLALRAILAKAAGEGVKQTGETLFLHVRYSPAILSNDKLMERLATFVHKYGFARNLAFTTLAIGVALIIKRHLSPNEDLTRYAWISLGVGVLLFYRYLKFFRQYSFEMFNTYGGGN